MRVALFSSVILSVLAGSMSMAAVRRVPTEYPSIQQAIEACSDGDTVIVNPGVYYETINFGGRNIVVTSTDPNDPRVVGYTIIDADGDGTVVTFQNGETPEAMLIGFTITGGTGTLATWADEYYKYFYGAGIYCENASPTITRNVIARNEAPYSREERLLDDGRTRMIVYSYSEGGGIACMSSSAVVTHNVIRNNSAYGGGGISAWGNVTIANNVIYGNSAAYGGGVLVGSGALVNNTIANNDATGLEGEAGVGGNVYAVFGEGDSLSVANNIICGATAGCGIFYDMKPRLDLIRFNDVWNNVPANYGMADPRTNEVVYGQKAEWTGRAGNISEDPLFRDAWNNNFHLQPASPCISAGDPAAIPAQGAVDIDGDPRIYAVRVDIGADEHIGYVKPLAEAGADQHVLAPAPITLDGTGSYFSDPCGVRTYQWSQTEGPAVALSAATAAQPVFTPAAEGWYRFQLVVQDEENVSKPDDVLVVVGNEAPVAEAGPDKLWPTPGSITLDGSRSHDADPPDHLSYTWTQLEGPSVVLRAPGSATPSFLCQQAGIYVFELVVHDGFVAGEPDTVKLEAAPFTLNEEALVVEGPEPEYTFHPAVAGVKVVYAGGDYWDSSWSIRCQDLETGRVDTLEAGMTDTMPRIEGDLIVWAAGPEGDYTPICTSVYVGNVVTGAVHALRVSTADTSQGYPVISGRKVVWLGHRNVNTRDMAQYEASPYGVYGADVSDLTRPAYFTIAEAAGHGVPYPYNRTREAQDDPLDISGDLVVWEGDGDIIAADLSDPDHIRVFPVCTAPERQYDPSVCGNWVVWVDERNDAGDIYGADLSDPNHIREFEVAVGRGTQLQPDIDGPLIAFLEGSQYSGQIRTACLTRQYGVVPFSLPGFHYGSGPQVDGATILWQDWDRILGVRLEFAYGLTNGPVQNLTTGVRYDYIQHAIDAAGAGEVIQVPPGAYPEKLRLQGRSVTVTSTDPEDPAVRDATIISGPGQRVMFTDGETADCVFTGFTVAGGSYGILCGGATPTLSRCTIRGNAYAGVKLWNESNPVLSRCTITDNGYGVEMWAHRDRRLVFRNYGTFRNCLITGNRSTGVYSGYPTLENCTIADNLGLGVDGILAQIVNSILYFNNQGTVNLRVQDKKSTVRYSDVQGGWAGEGNLDADPLFIAGDYHLKSRGWSWNVQQQNWAWDDVTSPCIDAGDPNMPLGDEPPCAPGDPLSERAGPNTRIDMGAYGGTPEASLAPYDSMAQP